MNDSVTFLVWLAATVAGAYACWRCTLCWPLSFLERLASTHVLWLWWMSTLMLGLGLTGNLTLRLVALACMGLAAASRLISDKRSTVNAPPIDLARHFPLRHSWGLFLALGFWMLNLLHAAAAPPRAWDALTYHLPRAVFWIQQSSFAPQQFPGAWKYYEYFAPVGDLLWAWTMLAGQGDGLLFLGLAFCASLLTLALLTFARGLGMGPERSLLGVAVVLLLPAAARFSGVTYVDNLSAGLLLFALMAAGKAWQQRHVQSCWPVLAAMSGALAAANKFSGVPPLMSLGVYLLVVLITGRSGYKVWIVSILSLAPWVLWMLHTYAATGSVTYPFELLGGRYPLLAGNHEMTLLHSGTGMILPNAGTFAVLSYGISMPLNFSLSLVLLVPAVLGGLRLWRRNRHWTWLVLATAFAAWPVVGLMAPENLAMRTLWLGIAGRHLLVPVALLVLAAAHAPWRFTPFLLGCIVAFLLVTNLLNLNLDWKPLDYLYTFRVCLPLLLALLTSVLIYWRCRRLPYLLAAMAIPIVAATWFIQPLRADVRGDFFRIAREQGSNDLHSIRFGEQDLVWRWLDQQRGLTVAFATGDEFFGQRWFLYPYFGSRLQNHLRYVAPPQDAIHSIDKAAREYRADLVAARCDFIAMAAPLPTELALVQSLGLPVAYATPLGKAMVFKVE